MPAYTNKYLFYQVRHDSCIPVHAHTPRGNTRRTLAQHNDFFLCGGESIQSNYHHCSLSVIWYC